MKMRLTSAALAAAMALNFTALPAHSLAEDICSGQTGFYSFTLPDGDKCPGERFGKLCSVDCSKKIKRERLERKLNKAPKPKLGRIYSYSEATQLSAAWDGEKIEKLIIEMDGKLNNDEKNIIRGALRGVRKAATAQTKENPATWPKVKYYASDIGVDPRLVYLTFITESRWVQVKGRSGERSIAQLMPSTAMELIKRLGKNAKHYDHSKKWHEGDNPLILSIYYLRDAVKAVGCKGIPFDQLSAQHLLYIYHFYNKGTTDYEPTWQQSNFANSAMNLMWTYKFVEKKIEETRVNLYAHVTKQHAESVAVHRAMAKKEAVLASKPKTEEKQRRKEALVKRLDSQIAEHLVAKEIAKDELKQRLPEAAKETESERKAAKSPIAKAIRWHEQKEAKKAVQLARPEKASKQPEPAAEPPLVQNQEEKPIPHTYFIELQAKKDAEEKAAKAKAAEAATIAKAKEAEKKTAEEKAAKAVAMAKAKEAEKKAADAKAAEANAVAMAKAKEAEKKAAEAKAKRTEVAKQTKPQAPLTEPILVKRHAESVQAAVNVDLVPSRMIAQNNAVPKSLEREISDLRASQAQLREQNRKFDDFINQFRSAKNGRR